MSSLEADSEGLDVRVSGLMAGGGVVLDLGCGAGRSLEVLKHRYRFAVGMDSAIGRLRRRGGMPAGWSFVLVDLDQGIPAQSACSDAVFANQAIEHLLDPVLFSREIYRVLKPGGLAVLTTPNVRYVRHLWKLVVGGAGPRTANQNEQDGVWDDGHLHYFTHRDLREIFCAAGFARVESRALIDRRGGGRPVRALLDRFAGTSLVREFLSGNMMIVAER